MSSTHHVNDLDLNEPNSEIWCTCIDHSFLVGFVEDPPSRGDVKLVLVYNLIDVAFISVLLWLHKIKQHKLFSLEAKARIDTRKQPVALLGMRAPL